MYKDPNELILPAPFSIKELDAIDRDAAESIEDVSLFSAVSSAFREQSTLYTMFDNTLGYQFDTEFELGDERFNELTQGIPQDRWDIFEDAVSDDHAQRLRERTLKSIKDRENLAAYGWAGVGLELAAAVTDLPAIAATVATEGALGPAIWGAKASRLGRAFRSATVSAPTAAGIEAYLVAQNPNKDPYDILFATAGGALLGGAIGATKFGKTSADEYKEALIAVQREAHMAQVAETARAIKVNGVAPDLDVPDVKPVEAANFELRKNAKEEYELAEDTAFSSYGKFRFDSFAILGRSPLALVRKLNSVMLEDAVNPGGITADLAARIGKQKSGTEFYKVYPNAYKEWAKDNGYSAVKRNFFPARSRLEFGTLVSRHIELGNQTDPRVIAAATRSQEIFADILSRAKSSGVKGFDEIPENLRYFTHIWNGNKFLDVDREFGKGTTAELLKKSLLAANREMSDDIAEKIAKGMSKKIEQREIGIDADLAKIFSTSNKDTLREILLDEFDEFNLSNADVDRIINQLNFDREGLPPRAKPRLKVDISTTIQKNGRTIGIENLMERDIEKVMNSYIQQMEGRIALADIGIKSDTDFRAQVSKIRAEAADKGFDKDRADRDINKLELFYSLIQGKPNPKITDPSSTNNRLLRLFMDYNFIRYMGQVGFAQVPELMRAVTADGLRGIVRSVPEFRKMIKRGADGELEDAVYRDLEMFGSIGVDGILQKQLDRLSFEDEYLFRPSETLVQKGIETTRGLIQPFRNFTANTSGLVPITVFSERLVAKAAANTLTDLAFGGTRRGLKKVVSKGTLQDDINTRLKMLGLDEEMADKVFRNIRENAKVVDSEFGGGKKLRALNMVEWEQDAAEAFGYAIARYARQAIQKNDLGNLHPFMTRPAGQLLLQFRSFMIVSYTKQFLHSIKRNDFAAYGALMVTTFGGALGYLGQTYTQAIGRPDREEFLAERLLDEDGEIDFSKIAAQAFARSSWSSFFPGAVDVGGYLGRYEPFFGYARSSGLATDLVKGLLPVQTIDSVGKSLQGLSALTGLGNPEYQFSQREAKAIKSLLPLQNAIGIKNVMEAVIQRLPETSKVN